MALTTGNSLYKDFYRIVGMEYTGYLSPVQLSNELERAFIQAIYDIFVSGNQTTTQKDRLNTLVNTGVVLTNINNNQIYTQPVSIVNVVNVATTSWYFVPFLPPNLVIGQTIIIQNIAGFTNNPPSGSYVVTNLIGSQVYFTAPASGGGAYTAGSGSFVFPGGMLFIGNNYSQFNNLNDYWRFLAMKVQFNTSLSLPAIVRKWSPITPAIASITGNSVPVIVTMNYYTNLRNEDNISITGVSGNTNANGSFYIKKLNDIQFALYVDKYFQAPVIGNGAYGGGGSLSRILYRYCTPYLSDEKINSLNKPSPENPRYELANTLIKIYPQDIPAQQVTIDYIRRPTQIYASGYIIDCTDSVINLENFYPKDFLTLITNVAANTFLAELRDDSGLNLTANTQQR